MKANEAPERIYLDSRKTWQKTFYDYFTIKAKKNDIEYIRTDTFIDKACMWLLLNADDYIVDGVEEHSSAMRHDFIEDFKKAMKEDKV